MSAVLEAGADDMGDDGDNWEVTTDVGGYEAVLEAVKRSASSRPPRRRWRCCPRTPSSSKARPPSRCSS